MIVFTHFLGSAEGMSLGQNPRKHLPLSLHVQVSENDHSIAGVLLGLLDRVQQRFFTCSPGKEEQQAARRVGVCGLLLPNARR